MRLNLVQLLGTLVLVTGSAAAAPIRYNLTNFAYEGGATATGSFRFDPTNNAVSDINIVLSGPNSGFNNFFAGGSVTFSVLQLNFRDPSFVPPPGQMYDGFLPSGSSPNAIGAAAQLQFLGTLLDGQNPTTMNAGQFVGFNYSSLAIIGPGANVNALLTSGVLTPEPETSGVPEPNTALQTGLAGVVLVVAWRIRRLTKTS